jgi:LAS superfamily LD-carboxypeptidase LdcB
MKSKLCITDSYRSYALQATTYASKPGLSAVPGTSNHGWALAVDLCGGIERFGSAQHKWMVENAPKFGWKQPSWARQGGGREEAWHWEFGNMS